MLFVGLNIQSGGGLRIDALLRYLNHHDPTVVALTEWRANLPGHKVMAWARAKGMHFASYSDGGTANGVFIASTLPFLTGSRRPAEPGAGVLVQAQFNDFILLACYFPQGKAKAPFFSRCAGIAVEHGAKPFLLLGDLNTGNQLADKDSLGAPYHCAVLFDGLATNQGLHDLWRRSNGVEAREWTWISHRGNRFRIDHAFGNEAFVRWADPMCEYDHTSRQAGATDHSAILVRTAD